MGNVWQIVLSRLHNKEVKTLLWGLNATGKTTTLYQLKHGGVVNATPTIGFHVESVDYKDVSFLIWDLGGCYKMRHLWKYFYENTQLIIFVVDSSDHERMSECKNELWSLLEEEELKNVIILVMANKQDQPNAMSVEEISQKLEVEKIDDRTIHVQGTCANSGDGLYEGLDWVRTFFARSAFKKSIVKPVKEVLVVPVEKRKSWRLSWWSVISSNCIHVPAQVQQ